MLWGCDADGVGAAGADGAAGDGLGLFVHADFYGSEVVVAAADGDAVGGKGWVGDLEEVDDLSGWERYLVIELGERGGNGYAVDGGAGEGEEGVG
jgi:hypothetical protein